MVKFIFIIALLFLAAAEPAMACITSEQEMRDRFSELDLDKNGELSFEEFLGSSRQSGQKEKSEELEKQRKDFFLKLDKDNSGQLTFEEYNSVAHFRCM